MKTKLWACDVCSMGSEIKHHPVGTACPYDTEAKTPEPPPQALDPLDLAPCPFCGYPAAMDGENGRFWVECTLCCIATPRYVRKDSAAEIWNRRALASSPPQAAHATLPWVGVDDLAKAVREIIALGEARRPTYPKWKTLDIKVSRGWWGAWKACAEEALDAYANAQPAAPPQEPNAASAVGKPGHCVHGFQPGWCRVALCDFNFGASGSERGEASEPQQEGPDYSKTVPAPAPSQPQEAGLKEVEVRGLKIFKTIPGHAYKVPSCPHAIPLTAQECEAIGKYFQSHASLDEAKAESGEASDPAPSQSGGAK